MLNFHIKKMICRRNGISSESERNFANYNKPISLNSFFLNDKTFKYDFEIIMLRSWKSIKNPFFYLSKLRIYVCFDRRSSMFSPRPRWLPLRFPQF